MLSMTYSAPDFDVGEIEVTTKHDIEAALELLLSSRADLAVKMLKIAMK